MNRGVAHVKTQPARWPPWKGIGTMEAPASRMRGCISADNFVVLDTDRDALRAARRRCVARDYGLDEAKHAEWAKRADAPDRD